MKERSTSLRRTTLAMQLKHRTPADPQHPSLRLPSLPSYTPPTYISRRQLIRNLYE